ncbi:MAG: hypothetical protein ACI31G_02140 [Bacilli bacterium]
MNKIIKFTFLTALMISLSSCNRETHDTSSSSSIEVSSSEEYSWPDDEKINVFYYKDYLTIDTMYYSGLVIPGTAITDIPPDPEEPTDPYFDTFVGWSKRAVIDDLSDLYDFSTIIPLSQSSSIVLYGIWLNQNDLV